MNETGLIIAEVAFLVLLYAFVWSIVRSSSRQLRTAQAPPPPPPARPAAEEPPAAAAPRRRPPPPPPGAPAGAGAPAARRGADAAEHRGAAVRGAHQRAAAADERPGREDSGRIDLAANVEPRLVVESVRPRSRRAA